MRIIFLITFFIGSSSSFAADDLVDANGHKLWDSLLRKHVSTEGQVDYQGFLKDKETLLAYIDWLSDNVPSDSDSEATKLSFWINAYNALLLI